MPSDGSLIGSAVEFLTMWVTEVGKNGQSKEDTVDHLLEDIVVVRKNLNFKDMPCRINASGGTCIQNFKCPYDHTLQKYHKQQCPNPVCQNKECMFAHSPSISQSVPTGNAVAPMLPAPADSRRDKSAPPPDSEEKKQPEKVIKPAVTQESSCCDLS